MKKELIELFNKFWDKRSRDIVTGCIGRIEFFDKKRMRADVQPLLEYKVSGDTTAVKFAVIGDIPVQFLHSGGYYIRPDYAKGDLVWITYSTFSIEHGLNNVYDDVSTGAFSRESASVVSGIAPENWESPELFKEDGLIIGHKDGNVNIQIADKEINITGNINVKGELRVSGEVIAMSETLQVGLSTHIHPTGVSPSGSPNPNT
jgi:hypothetical protein